MPKRRANDGGLPPPKKARPLRVHDWDTSHVQSWFKSEVLDVGSGCWVFDSDTREQVLAAVLSEGVDGVSLQALEEAHLHRVRENSSAVE